MSHKTVQTVGMTVNYYIKCDIQEDIYLFFIKRFSNLLFSILTPEQRRKIIQPSWVIPKISIYGKSKLSLTTH